MPVNKSLQVASMAIKDNSFEQPKHMFKLIDGEMIL